MGPWSVISQNLRIFILNFLISIACFDVTAISSVAMPTIVFITFMRVDYGVVYGQLFKTHLLLYLASTLPSVVSCISPLPTENSGKRSLHQHGRFPSPDELHWLVSH